MNGIGQGEHTKTEKIDISNIATQSKKRSENDDVVIVIEDKGELLFYKLLENGKMVHIEDYERQRYKETLSKSVTDSGRNTKVRKRRGPMSYKKCSQCPVKYRFGAKLQHHMKTEHNINLYICKVCFIESFFIL